MRRKAALATVLSLAAAAPLAGCASTPPEETPVAAVTVANADSCIAYCDVLTIVFNAELARPEGRMAQQERDGWLAPATRVLDGVPTRGECAVSDAAAALRDASPMIPSGAARSAQIRSTAWN